MQFPASDTGSERRSRLLSLVLFLLVASAPLEGYLIALHPQASKLLPALLLLGWAVHLVSCWRLPAFPLTSWLLAGLALAVLVSSAINVENPYILLEGARWLPFLALAMCFIDLMSRVVDPSVAIAGAITGALCSAGGAVYSVVVQGESRATGPMQDPNDLAYVLVAAVPLLLLAPPARLSSPFARFLLPLVLVGGMLLTLSRGAALAILVVLTWAGFRRLLPMKGTMVAAALVLVGGALLWAMPPPALQSALAQKGYIAQGNVDTRIIRWEAAARLLAEHLLFGAGPGGVQEHYVEVSRNAELAEQTPVTHNMYLNVAADLGLVGFTLFVSVIVLALVNTHQAEAGSLRRQAIAVQGSLVAVVIASIFLSQQFYMPLWSGIALAAALRQRARHSGLLYPSGGRSRPPY